MQKKPLSHLLTLAASLLALCLPASGEEATSRRAPAVVRTLTSRYSSPLPPPAYFPGMSLPGIGEAKGLADLVAIERRMYPGAVVTAGFYDYRTVSRYRSHAGLHLGYDIAMPYGNPVAVGWPGVVTSIVVWSGEEHGITVVSPDGTQVTYGHLSPKVKVGQVMRVGQIVGTIVRDHVDVKMRDASGNYKDFGGRVPGVAGSGSPWVGPTRRPGALTPALSSLYTPPSWVNLDWARPEPSPESLLTSWLVALNSRDLAKEEVDRLQHQAYLRKLEEQQLKGRLEALEETHKLLKLSEQDKSPELQACQDKLRQIKVVRSLDTQQLTILERQLKRARAEVSEAKQKAEAKGLTYASVEGLVRRALESDKSLSESVDSYRRNVQTRNASHVSELQAQLEEAQREVSRLDQMQKLGGVDVNELETAREKRRLLQVQLRSAKPEPHDWFFKESEE